MSGDRGCSKSGRDEYLCSDDVMFSFLSSVARVCS